MLSIEKDYLFFGLSSSCTDEELRSAYRNLIRKHHPDLNPHQLKHATKTTREIIERYVLIRNRRANSNDTQANRSAKQEDSSSPFEVYESGINWGRSVNSDLIDGILLRKNEFKEAWNRFCEDQSDIPTALKLIHFAFRAERHSSLIDLLKNDILIDASPLLLSLDDHDLTYQTLIRWAELLIEMGCCSRGIQMKEDLLSSDLLDPSQAKHLRFGLVRNHYHYAQGHIRAFGLPSSDLRIRHLTRAFELDHSWKFVYRYIALIYLEEGNYTEAKKILLRDQDILRSFPEKKLKLLGLEQQKQEEKMPCKARKKLTRRSSIGVATPKKILEWSRIGHWDKIIQQTDLTNFSPKEIRKSSASYIQITKALIMRPSEESFIALRNLFSHYSFSLIKNPVLLSLMNETENNIIPLLKKFSDIDQLNPLIGYVIEYLRMARKKNCLSEKVYKPEELLTLFKSRQLNRNVGYERYHFERIYKKISRKHPIFPEFILAHAQCCMFMRDVETAVSILEANIDSFSGGMRRIALKKLADYKWQTFSVENDDFAKNPQVIWVLNSTLDYILTSDDAGEIVDSLYNEIHRRMEPMGQLDLHQWVLNLLRTEAPGSWVINYSNNLANKDRKNCVANIELSVDQVEGLLAFTKRIKSTIPDKLQKVLKGQSSISGGQL